MQINDLSGNNLIENSTSLSLSLSLSLFWSFKSINDSFNASLDLEEHAVKGSEVFVGGLSRTITESNIREVCHCLHVCIL